MALRYWVGGGNGNWNSTTNWSTSSGGASGASVPGTSDDAIFNGNSGAGDVVINVATANVLSCDFEDFTGNLVVNNVLSTRVIKLGVSMTFDTKSGTPILRMGGATTCSYTSNSVKWPYRFEIGSTSTTITLQDDIVVQDLHRISSGGTMILNGYSITIDGDIRHTGTSIANTSGTTTLIIAGEGIWNDSNGTGGWGNNITIDTGSDFTITSARIGAITLTYTAGNVDASNSTLFFSSTVTFDTDGITWHNLTRTVSGNININLSSNFNATGTLLLPFLAHTLVSNSNEFNINTLSFGNGTASLTLDQDIQIVDFVKTAGVENNTINNNTITITGNINLGSATGAKLGTTNIVYAGTGTWSSTATGENSYGFVAGGFTIDTPGVLTLQGNISATNLTYTAGTIINDNETFILRETGTLDTAGITFSRIRTRSDIAQRTYTLTSALTTNALDLIGASSTGVFRAFNGEDLIVLGNTLRQNSFFTGPDVIGTSRLVFAGTGTLSSINSASIAIPFIIDTAGTLTISGSVFFGSTLTGRSYEITYVTGSVVTTGSTVHISRPNNGTFILNSGNITWNNVTSLPTNTGNLQLNSKLSCNGDLELRSTTNFTGSDGTFDVSGFITPGTLSTITLQASKTYTIRNKFERIFVASDTSNQTFQSNSSGVKAILTLNSGASIDLWYSVTQDIDSSNGRTIYSYKGTSFTNTDNWQTLPTDVTATGGGGEVSTVFVN